MLGAKAFLDIPIDDHEARLMGKWYDDTEEYKLLPKQDVAAVATTDDQKQKVDGFRVEANTDKN